MLSIPLSLYIHIPWCIRKCPYCDFSSYPLPNNFAEEQYIAALIQDFKQDLPLVQKKSLASIFIGGGTPSLFSPKSFERLLNEINRQISFEPNIEITMEANPGTITQQKLMDFHAAGINRLSIGIQSFQNEKLNSLGRIHNSAEAKKAIEIAINAGFNNFNLDLMHGLPKQTIADALDDLKVAIDFCPQHISWYQLTIEPGTQLAKNPPKLPNEDLLSSIQKHGNDLLVEYNYKHYEISAYCKNGFECHHNLNYWQFGDYLGIGAGAHGKITNLNTKSITRYCKFENPEDYLEGISKKPGLCHPEERSDEGSQRTIFPPALAGVRMTALKKRIFRNHLVLSKPFISSEKNISESELPLEFMMNALRLIDGVPTTLFEERTGLKIKDISKQLKNAQQEEFIENSPRVLKLTPHGLNFLNKCLEIFVS